MANTKEQIPQTAMKLLRLGKIFVVTGLLVIFANLFFLPVPELAGGIRILGAIVVVLGCIVNLLGLISGAREKSRAV